MKLSRRMKIAGIAMAVVIVALVVFVAFMFYVGSDALSGNATGSELIEPDGVAAGKALVVYNPGISGAPKDAAAKIAGGLQERGYEVTLAGVKSAAAANVSGYDVIVAGGPIYGGKVSPSIEAYLRGLVPPAGVKVGAFAIGQSVLDEPFPGATGLKAKAVFSPNGDIDRQSADFVAALLEQAQS